MKSSRRGDNVTGGSRSRVPFLVHVDDLHATILHLLGLDHLKLTFKFQGRNFRLTDVAGDVIQKLIA